MSSNEDPSAGRDQEEKGTEEVEVGGRSAAGGENEAVGGGGVDPAAGGGGGSVRVGVLGSSTYTDTEVREMLPGQRLEAVTQGKLSERQMRNLLGGSSKTPKELLQSLLLTTASAEASAAEAVAAVDAKVAAEAALAVAAAAAAAAVGEARAEASAAVAVAAAAGVEAADAGGEVTAGGTDPAGSDIPGSAGAIAQMLRDALQGPGHSRAVLIAGLTEGLPMDQKIEYVLPFLQDIDEGLSNAGVAAALYQGFGMSAGDTVSEILAAPAMAPGGPDEGLTAPGAASGDRLGAGLGASASGDGVSQVDFEDTARLAYQRLKQDLGPPIHTEFLATELPAGSDAALRLLREIGKRQHWDSLLMGDAPALGVAVLAAWSSGQHGSLSSGDRIELTAVTAISEFQGGRLAEILKSTPVSR